MNNKVAALTLDDGPNTSVSVKILDELEKRSIPATYFVIGSNIDCESAQVMQRAYALGCEYANHSWGWESLGNKDPQEITHSIAKTNDKIVEYLGKEACPKFFRAPNLNISSVMIETVKKLGYPLINGIVGNDWEPDATIQSIFDLVVPKVRDGSIILLHDGVNNKTTAGGIGNILDTLIEKGFTFVTLSELFRLKKIEPEAGKIYESAG